MNIEGLIEKAKGLGLSYLRVAEGGEELEIELPRASSIQIVEVAEPQGATESEIVSQLVGYFRAVEVQGSRVERGGVIGVIESLGLPNDVVSPASGTLIDLAVSDGDAVEYGTVLARIKL